MENKMENEIITNLIDQPGYNARHAMGEMGKIERTEGTNEDFYVHFPITTELSGGLNRAVIRIHKELLNKLSNEYYNPETFTLNIPLFYGRATCSTGIKQPYYLPQPYNYGDNGQPLKNLLFPEDLKCNKYSVWSFNDGDRLHWSEQNIDIIARRNYNEDKEYYVILDKDWDPFTKQEVSSDEVGVTFWRRKGCDEPWKRVIESDIESEEESEEGEIPGHRGGRFF